MRIDQDAVLWSTPEHERADRPLIVLLHGYGSHEGDLFSLSPALPLEAAVASVRAPIAESGGFAWFPRIDGIGSPSSANADAAAVAVLDWLDTLHYTSVNLLGFSQGAALALQLIRHAPTRFSAVVAIAGFVPPGNHPGDPELVRARPPVFWGRGTLDQVIPLDAVERTEAWLPAHTDATIRIYEDLPHAISTVELTDLAAFLREHIPA